MTTRVLLCGAAVLAMACDGNETGQPADVPDTGINRCEGEDLEPMPSDGPLLSEQSYQTLVSTGLFASEADVMTVSYNEGYNLNFEITKEQASSLLPCNLTPMRLKLLESDPEPHYYLSWYMAVIDSSESNTATTRIDLFTYAYNEDGEPALHFVSSYMGISDFIKNNESVFAMFEEIFDFFALDSRTGEPAYPHYYTSLLTADQDTFKLVYEDSIIEASPCEPVTENERFTRLFVAANSQIYRTPIDKNVNYFNQSFLSAKVETRDLSCITHQNLTGFHPLLKDLRSVHFYGSKDKKITWYYEMCTAGDCGNPFR